MKKTIKSILKAFFTIVFVLSFCLMLSEAEGVWNQVLLTSSSLLVCYLSGTIAFRLNK